jgi:hypothetical protein
MPSAKVIALKARPYQTSHLCFPVHGIIDVSGPSNPKQLMNPIQLGDSVKAFPFDKFYANLSNASPADASRLSYDSTGILNDARVQASLLMTQRAESTKAVLDKAVNARQNAYYAKYQNRDDIIGVMQSFYKASNLPNVNVVSTPSKPDMLITLRNLSQSQDNALTGAYVGNQRPLVVETTTSVLQTTGAFPDTTQTIANTDYVYRTPTWESNAQNLRAQISLIDQQFADYMTNQNLPNLKQVFLNELQDIDLDVKRLQVAFLNTILLSPIEGTVTGIYKNPGDWVQAGEPVIRVENNTSVILVGTLAYQGAISIGSQVTVTTSLFDASAATISGSVIAVRGHPNQDDVWDVHLLCENTAAPVLPVNYNFDHDDTTVTVP